MKIKPYDTTVEKLFVSNFYQIPRFQRPYSWDKGNIDEFWNDVVVDERVDHFIGSMVFYEGKSGGQLFVVDGQQRLTTITIFLAALRDAFSDVGEAPLAKGTQGFIARTDKNAEERYVLLTETSYPYLQENIQKYGAPDLTIKPSPEEKDIQSAYAFASAQLKLIIESARAKATTAATQKSAVKKRLVAIRDLFLSLSVIVVQLDSEDDAYVVFETLNTRGKDLEPKDLVKNLLSKLLPPKSASVDTTKIKWAKLLEGLAKSEAGLNPSTYLHHFWLSRFEYTAERTLFPRIKKHLNSANAAAFLNDLVNDVETYRRIFEPESYPWEKEERSLRDSLLALGIFRVRQPTPMLLSTLRAYYANAISLKQAKATIGAIERFHFAYTAVAGQSSSGGVSKMYAAAARELSRFADANKRAKHLQDFQKKLEDRRPDQATFDAGFAELRYSKLQSRDRLLIRYILSIFDRSLRDDTNVDYGQMTIEHIASQSPPAGSPHVETFDTIGSLLLLSEELNGKLKNKAFSDKKKLLVAANVPFDQTLKKATSWGAAEIQARTKDLSKKVYDLAG